MIEDTATRLVCIMSDWEMYGEDFADTNTNGELIVVEQQ